MKVLKSDFYLSFFFILVLIDLLECSTLDQKTNLILFLLFFKFIID